MTKKKKILTPKSTFLTNQISRRSLIESGISMSAFASLSSLIGNRYAIGQEVTVATRLVWFNMSGGWDVLEATEPKVSSTSGIDMVYDYGLASQLIGSEVRIGRWLGRLARLHGDKMVVLRGINMGTTSHMAGRVYMDTGILSNSGEVNSASIPSIVASESQATIPIIQLNGGSDPQIDRGLLNPVSVVRAQNLDLYRAMYPQTDNQLNQKLLMLDHLRQSLDRQEAMLGSSDRLSAVRTAESKVRVQFDEQVGQKLELSDEDRTAFTIEPPANLNGGQRDAFALALKLLKNDLVTCVNLGLGGFDTHANQERSLQPIMENFDYLLSTFITELDAAGQLDDTLIVVYSDFGRTPKVNQRNGRDHWPFGGALMLGGGIEGGRAVGGTDDDMRGLKINENTGLIDENGITLNPTHLGAAVLELTLGADYLGYRSYLERLPALVRLRTG